jgi:cytochrome b561
LDRHIGISGACGRLRVVRAAADLAAGPRILRPTFLHALIGIAIACLVAAHIGAALYHHFVRRDRVLLRMISG